MKNSTIIELTQKETNTITGGISPQLMYNLNYHSSPEDVASFEHTLITIERGIIPMPFIIPSK